MFKNFDPTASATAYGLRPKFVSAEQSATAEGEIVPTVQHCTLTHQVGAEEQAYSSLNSAKLNILSEVTLTTHMYSRDPYIKVHERKVLA